MAWIKQIVTILLVIAMSVVALSFGNTVGTQSSFYESLEDNQGKVVAFEAGLIVVEFEDDIINACGDTSIYGFITTPGGFTLQLKPVFIPAAKSGSVHSSKIVFPIFDVYAFLTEPGVYTLEFYVENNCSILHQQTVTLPPVPMVLEGGQIDSKHSIRVSWSNRDIS